MDLIVIYCNGEKYLINKNQIYEPFPEKEGKEEDEKLLNTEYGHKQVVEGV